MWLTARSSQSNIAIGIIVFSISMTTHILPFPLNVDPSVSLMHQLLFAATLGLFFGILKAHPKHIDKFLLFWLTSTAFCCFVLLHAGYAYFNEFFRFSNPLSLFGVLFPSTLAVVVAYLWNIMYTEYVELTVGAANQVEEVGSTDELLKAPPKTTNIESPTILVHGHRLNT